MNRAIKYRLYPNTKQRQVLGNTFGSVRFVYNRVLDEQIRLYEASKSHMSRVEANSYLAHDLKQNNKFLKEVDSTALQSAVRNLDDAYSAFFKNNSDFPKHKSKRNKQSYRTINNNNSIRYENKKLKLPKLGFVRIDGHRMPKDNWRILNATVSRDKAGDYYVSVLFDYDFEITENYNVNNAVGLDYKSNGLFSDSEGNVAEFDRYYRKSESKISTLNRELSRKKKGSRRYNRTKKQLAKTHRKISNQRLDKLQKLSTEIANRYDVVCVETLDLKSIASRKSKYKLGKSTCDNGYGMFVNMLDYKLYERGKKLVHIDKWYPSSQLCCECGKRHKEMKSLSRRTMNCGCGNVIDRDVNAAINIRNEGIRELTKIKEA